jgi:hypothetical protein
MAISLPCAKQRSERRARRGATSPGIREKYREGEARGNMIPLFPSATIDFAAQAPTYRKSSSARKPGARLGLPRDGLCRVGWERQR